eukprot:Rhum_TRINITY_DN14698_c15_g1::Rhum_TRINITY_DN14698_c15_g1_i1::g.110089::m.110089
MCNRIYFSSYFFFILPTNGTETSKPIREHPHDSDYNGGRRGQHEHERQRPDNHRLPLVLLHEVRDDLQPHRGAHPAHQREPRRVVHAQRSERHVRDRGDAGREDDQERRRHRRHPRHHPHLKHQRPRHHRTSDPQQPCQHTRRDDSDRTQPHPPLRPPHVALVERKVRPHLQPVLRQQVVARQVRHADEHGHADPPQHPEARRPAELLLRLALPGSHGRLARLLPTALEEGEHEQHGPGEEEDEKVRGVGDAALRVQQRLVCRAQLFQLGHAGQQRQARPQLRHAEGTQVVGRQLQQGTPVDVAVAQPAAESVAVVRDLLHPADHVAARPLVQAREGLGGNVRRFVVHRMIRVVRHPPVEVPPLRLLVTVHPLGAPVPRRPRDLFRAVHDEGNAVLLGQAVQVRQQHVAVR